MLKKKLHEHCINFIQEKLNILKHRKTELINALESEDKSSAGDKHETGRAMIQIEREKLGRHFIENDKYLTKLNSILENTSLVSVSFGSLVITNNTNYYLSIPAGCIKLSHKTFCCISLKSPMGLLLIGKEVGDQICYNNITSEILEIK